jgi:hypothetical protein
LFALILFAPSEPGRLGPGAQAFPNESSAAPLPTLTVRQIIVVAEDNTPLIYFGLAIMWHTSSGDRTLAGAEARLIKEALTGIAEQIIEERSGYLDQWEYGIRRFDELTLSQRLKLLEQVAIYLLKPTNDTLELTAVNEAAVGALFEHMLVEIDLEIDNDEGPVTHWRSLVLAAYAECYGAGDDDEYDDEDDVQLPAIDSDDHNAWSFLIDLLEDSILWGRDSEMEEFLDVPLQKSAMLKQLMGINDDYYSAPAPDENCEADVDETYLALEAILK